MALTGVGRTQLNVTLRGPVLAAAAHYLLQGKHAGGKPACAVMNFHLGNGAELRQLNWNANLSPKVRALVRVSVDTVECVCRVYACRACASRQGSW